MNTKTINLLTMKKTNMVGLIKKFPISTFLSVMLLVVSCGENVDPTKADIKLEMKATTSLSTINTNARIANSGIEFTKVLIGVTEIEFESMGDNDSENYDVNDDHSGNDSDNDDHSGNDSDNDDVEHEDEIEFKGLFIVDLLNGTSDPDFGITNVIPGIYEEIEVKISPILDDGNSIIVALTYQKEGMMEPLKLEFTSTKEFNFEIEHHSGIQLDGNTINQILILFDLDKFFAGVDLTQAILDEDGIIRINSTSNTDISAIIWDNLHYVFEAGEDDDDDDEFDDHNSDDD